jgi:hypothetical protein
VTAAAVLVVAALIAPHAIGAWRGIRIGRSAVGSHRHSVRLGVRMGRWQTVLVLIMTAALIGAR